MAASHSQVPPSVTSPPCQGERREPLLQCGTRPGSTRPFPPPQAHLEWRLELLQRDGVQVVRLEAGSGAHHLQAATGKQAC